MVEGGKKPRVNIYIAKLFLKGIMMEKQPFLASPKEVMLVTYSLSITKALALPLVT